MNRRGFFSALAAVGVAAFAPKLDGAKLDEGSYKCSYKWNYSYVTIDEPKGYPIDARALYGKEVLAALQKSAEALPKLWRSFR